MRWDNPLKELPVMRLSDDMGEALQKNGRDEENRKLSSGARLRNVRSTVLQRPCRGYSARKSVYRGLRILLA